MQIKKASSFGRILKLNTRAFLDSICHSYFCLKKSFFPCLFPSEYSINRIFSISKLSFCGRLKLRVSWVQLVILFFSKQVLRWAIIHQEANSHSGQTEIWKEHHLWVYDDISFLMPRLNFLTPHLNFPSANSKSRKIGVGLRYLGVALKKKNRTLRVRNVKRTYIVHIHIHIL